MPNRPLIFLTSATGPIPLSAHARASPRSAEDTSGQMLRLGALGPCRLQTCRWSRSTPMPRTTSYQTEALYPMSPMKWKMRLSGGRSRRLASSSTAAVAATCTESLEPGPAH